MTRLRDERPEDIGPIHAVTQAAFAPKPFSDGSEGAIIRRLRERGELVLSLVIEDDSGIIGHAAFSAVRLPDKREGVYALGPISVRPDRQGEGHGGRMIREGLARLKAMGATGCVLVGDPRYYSRFGFRGDCGLTYKGLPAAVVQGLFWDGSEPQGEIAYASGFER